jgi:hypothetical protein
MPKERPLEVHFTCWGRGGMTMTVDCVGREFTSRTANYDFIFDLPRLDTRVQRVGRVRAPKWTYGVGPGEKDELDESFSGGGVTNVKQASELGLGSDTALAGATLNIGKLFVTRRFRR